MSVHSLIRKGGVQEAPGWVAEQADAGAQMLVTIVVDANGMVHGHGFGPVTPVDLAYMGTFLQHRAMQMTDGEGGD